MSHLSKIKTKINDSTMLKKTLNDLKLNWNELREKKVISNYTIILHLNDDEKANMIWDGTSYELLADSNTWQQKRILDALLERIHQTYAYNIILSESEKQGFDNTNTNILQDGSLRIVLERWQS